MTRAGKPLAPPAEPFDEAAATPVVNQQAGVAAAARGIGRKQGADAQAEVGHARVGIGQRPGGTHRGARTATHAQMRLDPDMVAVGRDRRGRADVDAQVATLLPRATVRADRCLVVEEFRLLELADRQRDFRHRRRLRGRIGAGSPIALRRLVHAKKRLMRRDRARGRSVRSRALSRRSKSIACTAPQATTHWRWSRQRSRSIW